MNVLFSLRNKENPNLDLEQSRGQGISSRHLLCGVDSRSYTNTLQLAVTSYGRLCLSWHVVEGKIRCPCVSSASVGQVPASTACVKLRTAPPPAGPGSLSMTTWGQQRIGVPAEKGQEKPSGPLESDWGPMNSSSHKYYLWGVFFRGKGLQTAGESYICLRARVPIQLIHLYKIYNSKVLNSKFSVCVCFFW